MSRSALSLVTRPPGTIVLRSPGTRFSIRMSVRALVVVVLLVVATVGLGIYAVTLGEYPIPLGDIVASFGGEGSDAVRRIVLEWRVPRILMAALAGAALGMSGAIFQSITRNPLGSPDIIGFTTGSYTGALVVILLLGGNYVETAAGALIGGILTAVVVYLLSARRGVQGFRLIVVGIAVAAFLQAVNGFLILQSDLETALAAASWGAGSFALAGWGDVLSMTVALAVLIPLLAATSTSRLALELGDDAAVGLGVRVERSRVLLLLVGVALVAVVTAAAGPVAFIALAAPQIAMRLTRSAGVALVPSAALGALLTLGSDVLAQRLFAPTQLPVGIVTVVIGGVYLVVLLVLQTRRNTA